jgi:hypothetical protein
VRGLNACQYDIPVRQPPSYLGTSFPSCLVTKGPPWIEIMTRMASALGSKQKNEKG